VQSQLVPETVVLFAEQAHCPLEESQYCPLPHLHQKLAPKTAGFVHEQVLPDIAVKGWPQAQLVLSFIYKPLLQVQTSDAS
jgi:hypothetical protein